MKEKTVTVSVRVKAGEKDRLAELAGLLGRQLGTEVTMAQAFSVAVKEAIEKRREHRSDGPAN